MSEYLFRGVCPVINLPFDEQLNIDYQGMEAVINKMINEGCGGICLFAFNTEPHKLSHREKTEVIQKFLNITAGRVQTLVGIIENSIFGALELAKTVEKNRGDGIILYPPSLVTPSGDVLLDYFKAIAGRVNLAVMIQDNPRGTGVQMPLEFLLKAFREIENFNYIKVECPVPVRKMRKLIEATDGKLKCFSGNGGIHAMDAFQAGAWGIMPGVVTAGRFVKIYKGVIEGRIEEARDIFENLLPLVWYEDQSVEFYISCEKELLKHEGVIRNNAVRPPGDLLSTDDKKELYSLYNRLKAGVSI